MASDSICDEHFSNVVSRSGSGLEDREVRRSSKNGRASPTNSAHGCLMRTSLQKLSSEKKAKRVRFYRNGDKFFKGLGYALSLERVRTLDALLEDLTRVLVDQVNLPKGVRFIFTLDGREKITNLDQICDGETYVCSSVDHYIKMDYTKNESPQWGISRKCDESLWINRINEHNLNGSLYENGTKDPKDFIRPKLVTIIRNGIKPRKVVRILLNKKTVHSFEQVLNDITKTIKLDTGAVRKVFTLEGKQVTSLADFFKDEDIFIAYGPEKYSHDDFDLDSAECKYLNSACRTFCHFRKIKDTNSLDSRHSYRRVHSPSSSIMDGSPCLSSRSSRSGSPKFASRDKFIKLNNSKPKLQNGHNNIVIPVLPKEVLQQYEIGKVIGDGNFAVVHECRDRLTKKKYALKIIDKLKGRRKEHMIASEVSILRKVKHPNIVSLVEEFDFPNELYLVMELVKGGDLYDAITSVTKYTEQDASGMVYNLASALSYLHSLNIVHRDIKPENLLVIEHEDGSKSLKLGDFGLAVEAIQPLYTVCGTPTYVAPEILAESGYGLKVDVWAAGVITYILLCGFPPFLSQENDQTELFNQILSGKFEFMAPFWDDISKSAKNLINRMLEIDPDIRYSSDQALQHPWVSGNLDNEMMTISRKISMHFQYRPKPSLKSASIALIANWSPMKEVWSDYHDAPLVTSST